jgi:hypothetical protein
VEGLGEYTTHHLDEEEAEIFPMARARFSPEDLMTLGKLFLEAKRELLAVELPEVPAQIDQRAKGAKLVQASSQGLGIGSLK